MKQSLRNRKFGFSVHISFKFITIKGNGGEKKMKQIGRKMMKRLIQMKQKMITMN